MHFQQLKYIKQKEELIKEGFMLNTQNMIKTWKMKKRIIYHLIEKNLTLKTILNYIIKI